jgi:hypothetical protein
MAMYLPLAEQPANYPSAAGWGPRPAITRTTRRRWLDRKRLREELGDGGSATHVRLATGRLHALRPAFATRRAHDNAAH